MNILVNQIIGSKADVRSLELDKKLTELIKSIVFEEYTVLACSNL